MKQNMIAVSTEAKNFVVALCASFPAQPGKGDKPYDLTQREAVDALVAFAEANREGSKVETDDEGNETLVSVDLLELEVKRTLALRGATNRANSDKAKVSALQKEKAELLALIAKLQGTAPEAES